MSPISQNLHDAVQQAVFGALDELNEQLGSNVRVPKRENAVLAGEGGPLDSLGLVNLIVLVEQHVEAALHRSISLIDEDLTGDGQHPFETVATLTQCIASKLSEGNAGAH